jgi:hypothetical protein
MLLPPLLAHSSPQETHYFPLNEDSPRRFLLHGHTSGPHTTRSPDVQGLTLNLYTVSSETCSSNLSGFEIQVDWKATLGRWASRYFTAVATWAIGIVGMILFDSWGQQESNGS